MSSAKKKSAMTEAELHDRLTRIVNNYRKQVRNILSRIDDISLATIRKGIK